MKKMLILMTLVIVFAPASFTKAQESSPYLMGEWFLDDSFKDGTTPIVTKDTQFTFLNPTPNSLTLEYAFFDEDGGFCGCDVDCLNPNGVVRYTMSGEQSGGQFVCTGKGTNPPKKTHGSMKTIVFQPTLNPSGSTPLVTTGALQVGFQIHFLSNGSRTEAGLKAISVIQSEIDAIHNKCVTFCSNHPGLCGGCSP